MKHSAIINAIFIVIYGGAIAIYLLTTSVVPKWLFAVQFLRMDISSKDYGG